MSDESSDSDTSVEGWSLRTALLRVSRKSMFDTTPHPFVPEGEVDRIVNAEAVMTSLNPTQPLSTDRELLDFILARAKKVFAIAVLAQSPLTKAMEWFKAKSIDDSQLPIKTQTTRWSAKWRGEFYDHQWRFFAPVFVTTNYSHTFEEARILPFISMSLVSDEGAFGEVSRAVIHERHMLPVSTIKQRWVEE